MTKQWYPVINDESCTECGACIEKCKHGVYDKAKKHPTVIYPEGCIDQCHGCQNLCPSGSISYQGDFGLQIPMCGCRCGS